MKIIKFKKEMFLVFLLFLIIPMHAQKDNLKFHSVSVGVGALVTPSDPTEGTINWLADAATKWRKNIFSVYVNRGPNFLSSKKDYLEANLTYGREIKLLSWAKLEGHGGLGFFNLGYEDEKENIDLNTTSVGFPLRAKLILFYKFIGIGINQNANFNPQVSTYSTDLILQVIF